MDGDGQNDPAIAELQQAQKLAPSDVSVQLDLAELYGNAKKYDLAEAQYRSLLAAKPNVLLLDEPTNDLDIDTLRALEEGLLDYPGCAVIITHDRWFLDRLATHILAFEGDSQAVWFEGNYQDYEADRKRRLGAAADQPHRIHYKKLIH